MRPDKTNELFCSGDLGESLRQYLKTALDAVNDVSESRFKHQSDAEIVQELVHKFSVRPLSLMEQYKSMRHSETKMQVIDPYRHAFKPTNRIEVNGVRVVVSIPFVGDPGLWKLKPNAWKSTFPTGEIRSDGTDGGSLEIIIEQPSDDDPARIKEGLDRHLSDIRFYIENQKTQIATEMAQLPNGLAAAVADRRQRLAKHSNLSELLGIPSAPENPSLARPTPLPRAEAKRAPTAVKPSAKWDVFLSHASEDKDDFARPLAEALTASGLRVWFDEFTLRVGDSLRRSIDIGLANSRFGVVVISPAFLQREWPQKELDGLVAREVGGEKVILPVWHNIDHTTVAKYSPTLADRLATHSAKGLAKVVEDLRGAIHPD